jgi:choline kinase
MDALMRAAGAERITLVAGDRHELVRAVVADHEDVDIVMNRRYAETNSLYSFSLARENVKGDVLLLNCDVLFPHQVLRALVQRRGSALAFDSTSGDEAEHMKVSVHQGRLLRMSKELPFPQTHGENLGVLHLTEAAARAAFAAAARLVSRGRERDWVGRAINAVAQRHPIACVDVAGLPWVEIDYPHDLAAARAWIWPAIAALGVPPAPAPTESTVSAAVEAA